MSPGRRGGAVAALAFLAFGLARPGSPAFSPARIVSGGQAALAAAAPAGPIPPPRTAVGAGNGVAGKDPGAPLKARRSRLDRVSGVLAGISIVAAAVAGIYLYGLIRKGL